MPVSLEAVSVTTHEPSLRIGVGGVHSTSRHGNAGRRRGGGPHAIQRLHPVVRVGLVLLLQRGRDGGERKRDLLLVLGVLLEADVARVELRLQARLELELFLVLLLEGEIDLVALGVGLALRLDLPQPFCEGCVAEGGEG